MGKEIEIVEKESIDWKNPKVFIGFPDVGLVGTIATFHLVHKLKLREFAYMDSKLFPPVVIVHRSRLSSPIRFYTDEKNSIVVIISEMPIPPAIVYDISEVLIEWLKNIRPEIVVILGGLIHPQRLELEKPEIYSLASNDKTYNLLKNSGTLLLEEGLLSGPNSILLKYCSRYGLDAIYLMVEAHPHYPDPESAAIIIEKLNFMFGFNVDTKELIEKGEEIKIKSKELMRKTQENLRSLQRSDAFMMYR